MYLIPSGNKYAQLWAKGERLDLTFLESLERLYRRDWAALQPLMPGEKEQEEHSQMRVKRPLAHGLVYYLVKLLSQLYARPVSRTSEQSDLLGAIYWPSLNETMYNLDRWSRLYGTALLGVYYTPEAENPIHHFALSPANFALQYPNDHARVPSSVMIKWSSSEFHYWTAETFIILDKDFKVIQENENPLGRIPFISVITDQDIKHPHIGLPFGGLDVLENANAIARLLKETGWTAVLQRGQPWTNSKAAKLALAPDFIIRLNDATETFGIASSGANIPAMLDTLKELLAQFLMTCGLSPDIGVGYASATVQSGVAIALHREDIKYDREARASLFKQVESDALGLVQAWLNADGLPIELDQTVSYPPLPLYRSTSETLAVAQFLYDKGLGSLEDVLRITLPELTSQDITLWVDRLTQQGASVNG